MVVTGVADRRETTVEPSVQPAVETIIDPRKT